MKEGDALPQNICFLCFNEIIRFYTFRLKAQRNNALLRSTLGIFADLNSEILIKNEDYQIIADEQSNNGWDEETDKPKNSCEKFDESEEDNDINEECVQIDTKILNNSITG